VCVYTHTHVVTDTVRPFSLPSSVAYLDVSQQTPTATSSPQPVPRDTDQSWGNASFAHCKLLFSLQQLRRRERAGLPPRYRTGGLGLKMQLDVFETWVCVDQHECSNSSMAPMDGWFCWVIDYRIGLPRERAPEQFVPWGHNGYLKLFRSGA
jgi:hypothetical protein